MRDLRKIMKQFLGMIAAITFWFLIWYFLSLKIGNSIFLPTPKDTLRALFAMAGREEFRKTICASFIRIIKGFLYAVLMGSILAAVACFIKPVRILLEPAMRLIKAVPVASFTILALLWVNSEKLSILVSFVIVLPVIYINVLKGFESVDKSMLEMSRVYKISVIKKLRFLYIPAVFPAFIAACRIGLGFCFKAGVAAEVIGRPVHSIGGQMYNAKLYLMTDELFAWTIVIVLISIFLEGICIYILNRISKRLKNVGKGYGDKTPGAGQRSRPVISEKACFVEVSDLSKAYGKSDIIRDISFAVRSGEVLCIMGESGAGKTTLLRIIMGLTRPDAGDISISGGSRLTAVFQEDRLIEDTDIYTNLYFADKYFDAATADAHLHMVGLEGLGKKCVAKLSGGMKRRVAIVRAVIAQPDILVLDEPFNGLDDDTKNVVAAYIRENCRDKIIILVTHSVADAERLGAKIYNI